MTQFIITKKIAKHGSQAIIIVPRMLEKHLPPQTMVKLTIDIVDSIDVINPVNAVKSKVTDGDNL